MRILNCLIFLITMLSINAQQIYVPGNNESNPGIGTSQNSNVGIKTNNPLYSLQVQKLNTSPALMIGGGYSGSPRLQTYGLDADPNAWMGFGTDMSSNVYEHSIYFPNYNNLGRLTIGSYNGSVYSTKMIVLENGNVGIGVNPIGKLHIDAGIKTDINGKVLIKSSSFNFGQVQIFNPTSDEASICFVGSGTTFGNAPQSADGNSHVWVLGTNIWSNGGNVFGIGNKDYETQTGNGQIFGITSSGNVAIGVTNPGNYKLNVWGTIRAHGIVVNTTGADFVFDKAYNLMPLSELEKFVKDNKHLPEVESALSMEENGVDLGLLYTKLLQKIEELTLYSIELNKRLDQKEQEIIEFKVQNSKINSLEEKIAKLGAILSKNN